MKVCNASSSLRQSPRLCWRHFLWQQGSILHTTFDQKYYRSSVHVDLGGWHYDGLMVAWHDLVSNFLDHWRLVDVTVASQNFNKSQSRSSGRINSTHSSTKTRAKKNLKPCLFAEQSRVSYWQSGYLNFYIFKHTECQQWVYVSWSITNNKHCSVNLAPTAMTTQSILQRAMSKIGLC